MLTDDDLTALELDGDVVGFHKALLRLRDYYVSRHVNPRESYTIGVAQKNNGSAAGGGRRRAAGGVDDTTVRQLGASPTGSVAGSTRGCRPRSSGFTSPRRRWTPPGWPGCRW